MMLFLDTEWADVLATELVSLALVGEKLTFYAERRPLPENPTGFVRSVVYPLLLGGYWSLEEEPFARRLRDFIARATAQDNGRAPTIAYDYWADRSLFEYAYCGFERDGPIVVPVDWFGLNQLNPHYVGGVEDYFRDNGLEAARRHNALVDAKAAQAGYKAAVRALARSTSQDGAQS
ncbi:MAG: 3'-5' exonuclease family protein [Sulfuricaulis sp.]